MVGLFGIWVCLCFFLPHHVDHQEASAAKHFCPIEIASSEVVANLALDELGPVDPVPRPLGCMGLADDWVTDWSPLRVGSMPQSGHSEGLVRKIRAVLWEPGSLKR